MRADRPSPDLLLSHGDWVRALARRLVGDEQLAEDVVQETWIAASAAGRSQEHPGWLVGVVRNLSRRALRARERRGRHERHAHPGNDPALPDEVLEREEVRRKLVEAVLALEEPYRSTLLLRYYQDLAPADIARKLGIPAATVRTRLKRGLEQMRAQLLRDPRSGRPRDWLPGIVALAKRGGVAPVPGDAVPWSPWPLIGGTILSTKTGLWIGGAAGMLLLLWLAIGGGSRDERPPELALHAPAQATEPASAAQVGAAYAERESAGESVVDAPARAGRVVDDAFSTPVYAVVIPDRGDPVFTGLETGRFELNETHQGASRIEVRAAGFSAASLQLELPAGPDELEVRLVPERAAELRVEHADGSAVAGAAVTWRAAVGADETAIPAQSIESRQYTTGEARAMTTDALGACRLPVATPVLVSVADPRTAARATARLLPGQSKRIVIGAGFVLRCVDFETLEPLAGLELDAWEPADPDAMSVPLRADELGEVSIHPGSFPVLVRRPGSAIWQSELIPLSGDARRSGPRESLLLVEAAPSSGVVLVGVRRPNGRVRLVDAETGEPVDAPVRVGHQRSTRGCGERDRFNPCSLRGPRSPFGSPDTIYHPQEGFLELPSLLRGEGSPSQPIYQNVFFVAAGYHPHHVELLDASALAADQAHELRLEPCQARQARVVHADGRPFQGHVVIHSSRHDVGVWSDVGRADGLHGPFDWYGGELNVDLGGTQEWSWKIASDALETEDVVTLTVSGSAMDPGATGAIAVHGAPRGAAPIPLVAKRGVGRVGPEFTPTTFAAGVYRFERLPPGSYLVGPRSWVRGAEMQSMEFEAFQDPAPQRMRVGVEPGAEARVEWVASWSSEQPIEGTVRLLGAAGRELFLVPRHGPLGLEAGEAAGSTPRLILGRRTPRLPLDANGRYRIPAGEPVPALIAVCVADPATTWGSVQDLRVIEVIAPGESADVPTGAVELRWQGPRPDKAVMVQYEIPIDGYRHPLFTFQRNLRMEWQTGRPLLIDTIPLHVRELRLLGRSLPLDLRAGETLVLDVQADPYEALPPR